MADLQSAHAGHLFEPSTTVARPKGPRRPPTGPMVRPRIGQGPRDAVRHGRHKVDGGVLMRAMAISGTVAALVLGGFYALQSFGYGGPGETVAMADHVPLDSVSARVPTVAPSSPPQQAQLAAALLSEQNMRESAAPSAPAPVPEARPSAADLARPAFLEPRRVAATAVEPKSLEAKPAAPKPAARSNPALAFANAEPTPPALSAIARETGSAQAADSGDGDGDGAPQPEARPTVADAQSGGDVTGSLGNSGRITSAINLRNAPRRGADVIGTLPAGTKVTVFSCKSWCEVAANGKRGYVYARAVDH